jgi:hypothetical protein
MVLGSIAVMRKMTSNPSASLNAGCPTSILAVASPVFSSYISPRVG